MRIQTLVAEGSSCEMKHPPSAFALAVLLTAGGCGSQAGMSSPTSSSPPQSVAATTFTDVPSPGSCNFSGAWGASTTVQHYEFDPAVVNPAIPDPVALKVKVPGGIDGASVALAGGGALPLAPSGPGLFCGMLTPAQVLFGYDADDAQHNFVGFLDLMAGATTRLRLNLFVNVADSQVPLVRVETVRGNLQATGHVANLFIPEQLPQSLDARVVAQRFYEAFADAYDFVNVVSTPAYTGNRFHVTVKNDVRGTGVAIFDNTAAYGSAGRLLGINRFPISSLFDMAEKAAIHEIGHQWINFLSVPALRAGSPHWPLSSLARGIMGFSIGGAGGEGGTFPFVLSPVSDSEYRADAAAPADAYNEMELYLMGLLGAESVPAQIVLDNQSASPCGGCVYRTTRVTVQDVINANGPRAPAFPSAPSRYTVATVVVSMERLLTQREMSFLEFMAARGEAASTLPYSSGFARGIAKPFALATGNRGSLNTTLGPRR